MSIFKIVTQVENRTVSVDEAVNRMMLHYFGYRTKNSFAILTYHDKEWGFAYVQDLARPNLGPSDAYSQLCPRTICLKFSARQKQQAVAKAVSAGREVIGSESFGELIPTLLHKFSEDLDEC